MTMDAKQILDRVTKAKTDFGPRCDKYAGAVTVELLREAIRTAGHNVSPRDSFIRRVPIEVDLLVVRPGVEPQFGCLYEPSDVLVAVEIKKSGNFGGTERIRQNFERVAAVNAEIKCCYLTLTEQKGHKWAVTTENLGYPAFTLFWDTGSKKIPDEGKEHWREFLDWLADKPLVRWSEE
jgi:hypothetical protein